MGPTRDQMPAGAEGPERPIDQAGSGQPVVTKWSRTGPDGRNCSNLLITKYLLRSEGS